MLGAWDKNSGAGVDMASKLAQKVAANKLAHSYMAFNTNYHDTGARSPGSQGGAAAGRDEPASVGGTGQGLVRRWLRFQAAPSTAVLCTAQKKAACTVCTPAHPSLALHRLRRPVWRVRCGRPQERPRGPGLVHHAGGHPHVLLGARGQGCCVTWLMARLLGLLLATGKH